MAHRGLAVGERECRQAIWDSFTVRPAELDEDGQ